MECAEKVEKTIDPRGLTWFLGNLDEKSRAILYYLWWHRHATIGELRKTVDVSDDYEVLYRLKEVINQKSRDIWGKPAVIFEQVRIDPDSGEKILFSWWYLENEGTPPLNSSGVLMDIFSEKENVTIIAQLPDSIDILNPEIHYNNGILKVVFKKDKSSVAKAETGTKTAYGH
jgi:hypothetical protein